jgi:hypothetical protein
VLLCVFVCLLSCGGVCVCVCVAVYAMQTSHQHGDFQIFYRVGVGRSSKDG